MKHSGNPPGYIGRFAPSPTGDLHFGSLVAAVASYLQARSHAGQWLVRMEDIDPPREVSGSAERILQDLNRLGMHADQPVLFQSTRVQKFQAARESLLRSGQAFWCGCARKTLPASGVYPGTCRNGLAKGVKPRSVRLKVDSHAIEFQDGLQGRLKEDLALNHGDFVIWRADNLPAYQLAVVVDDAFQGITEVVRGADLLDSTARQIYLQRNLGLPTPHYVHLPVATAPDGSKLSKRLASDPVAMANPINAVRHALQFLGHEAPGIQQLDNLWAWAVDAWDIARVPGQKAICPEPVSPISA